MRPLAHSETLGKTMRGNAISRHRLTAFAAVVLGLAVLAPANGQQAWRRVGDSWVRVYSGSIPATARLRVRGHGPVTVAAGTGREISYSVTVSVIAPSAARAQLAVNQQPIRVETDGDWAVLSTPGGSALSTVVIHAPRLSGLAIGTTNGAVDAKNIDGSIDVNTGAGEVSCDRIRGDCSLVTGGGDIHVGEVSGSLRCGTKGGHITVKSVRGPAILATDGGDIEALQAGGSVNAQTVAGSVHIGSANGAVDAATGGGEIVVDKSTGIVTARNLGGPVEVGAAAGIRCESHSGGVRVNNITGAMRVTTSAGSIFASVLGSRWSDSFLSTGNGDITVVIPSNVGVNVRAVNMMTDNVRRIVSDFKQVQTRFRGSQLVAEGAINGGGPLLQISGMGGTIFIKKQ
jgi:DUF4097 and DUF4098 domain-containing protein YvlB